MFTIKSLCGVSCLALCLLVLGCGGTTHLTTVSTYQLAVQNLGNGAGTVTSSVGGISCGQTCSASYASGTSVTLTATPNSGSTFTGWSAPCTGTGSCTVTVSAATAITATFTVSSTTPPPVQLTVSAAGTGTGTITSSPSGITCGQTCSASFASGTSVTLTATPATGSTFAGWSGGCSGTGACIVTLAAKTSITATFNSAAPPPQVQLTVQSGGTGAGTITSSPSGINCGTTCSAGFAPGTTVTLTATPGTGSTFAGWAGACTGTGPCSLTLTANSTVTATFNTAAVPPVQLVVKNAGTGTGTVTSSPSGINCGTTCSASFAPGTAVTLTATPSAGSTFAGWAGGCTGTGACSLTLAANTTVTATFNTVPPVQLAVHGAGTGAGTITSSPSGINCGTTCTASFASGTSVTLTATPSGTSTFAGWSGACTGTSTCTVSLTANTSVTATFNAAPVQITVQTAGTGTGTVTSTPSGINCGATCTASFSSGASLTLTANASSGSTFAGWSGACSGMGTCTLTPKTSATATATFNIASGDISVINHIVILAQENRSLDNYFGAMREYWAQNGYPDQSFDGLAQFNPTTGAAPLKGPAPSNPGCDPASPPPAGCAFDTNNPISSFHLKTVCTENTSPSWNESHVQWDYYDQVGKYPAKLNAWVKVAAGDARAINPPYHDTDGIRAMGYYDGTDLNYDYFMASNFATSDRMFHPEMSRTNPNHEYLIAATSGGYAYPNGTDAADTPQLKSKTIYEELQNAGITWKIYVNPEGSSCTGPNYSPSCLMNLSYLKNFTYASTVVANYPENIAPISQYGADLQNGTLPQVAVIEPASEAGLDEHGSDNETFPTNIQKGVKYVSTLINGLMQSSSWSDSAFILTYDENGGLFDHVPPQKTVSPDGIKPIDLLPGDLCTKGTGPTCDFTYTGYRVPFIVVSPYAKQRYVSHTVADTTSILKFIETRFNLPALTKRDAAQPDLTEFFDFSNPPWMKPPNPPTQNTSNPCYLNALP